MATVSTVYDSVMCENEAAQSLPWTSNSCFGLCGQFACARSPVSVALLPMGGWGRRLPIGFGLTAALIVVRSLGTSIAMLPKEGWGRLRKIFGRRRKTKEGEGRLRHAKEG